MPSLANHGPLSTRSCATLSRPDLHLGNLFVSREDHTQISCLINWQSTNIFPSFLQARWPTFLTPPKGYTEGSDYPQLSKEVFERFAGRKLTLFEYEEAFFAKAYEIRTAMDNWRAYDARWQVSAPFRELFFRVSKTCDGEIVPLREYLDTVVDEWEEADLTGQYSIRSSHTGWLREKFPKTFQKVFSLTR